MAASSRNSKDVFRRYAQAAADAVGSPAAFLIAISLTVVWAISGIFMEFSDAWQLIINTLTNVVTFFIVFLIQNSQNRDTKAIHLKLDELLRAVKEARTSLVSLENLSDDELNRLQQQFIRIRQREERKLEQQ